MQAAVLPRDLLEAIASSLTSAWDVVALERTSVVWRGVIAGLGNTLWRQLAVTRFPRLVAILQCSAASESAPSFRTIYRSQLEAELAGRPKPAAASVTLKDFILTLEIHVNGQLKASWTGSAESMSRYGGQLMATFASFGPEDGPDWFNAARDELLASDDEELLPDGPALSCVATLYATRRLQTVQLYRSAPCIHTGSQTLD